MVKLVLDMFAFTPLIYNPPPSLVELVIAMKESSTLESSPAM